MSWDVHAVYELPYADVVSHFSTMVGSAQSSTPKQDMPLAEDIAESGVVRTAVEGTERIST